MTDPNVRPELEALKVLLASLDLRPGDEWYAYIHKGGYDLCVDSAPRQPDHSNPDRIVGRFACGGYAIKCLPIVARVMNDAPDLIAHIERLQNALRPFAEQHTIAELMAGIERPEWIGATPERRIELMGERKRVHDAAILEARATLSQGKTDE